MPLNIEFKNIHDQFGRLTIDRDNLIFQFIPKSTNQIDYEHALKLRTLFSGYLKLMMNKEIEEAIISIYPMTDKRHMIDDHVVNNDRESPHYHLKLNQMIDFQIVNRLLNALPPALMKQFIIQADKELILTAVKGYFHELEVDPAAFQIEQEYRDTKQIQLKEAMRLQKIEDKKTASEHEPVCKRKRKSIEVPFTLFPSVETLRKKPSAKLESKRQKILYSKGY